MEQWVGIVLGLILVIVLIILYKSRSSNLDVAPTDVIPTQMPKAEPTPAVPALEPSPVIDHPVISNVLSTNDFYPEALSFTSLKMTSELGAEDDEPQAEKPQIKLPTAPEDQDLEGRSMYSAWSP